MAEYRFLVLTILATFVILLVGAYFSPTFMEQKSFLELFVFLGALLFIFSIVVIFATLGFHSFALYLALFLAIVISEFGIGGALLVSLMTYTLWGFVFAMEVLLFANGSQSAKEWFMSRYTFKTFKIEYKVFYPLMGLLYVLLEVLPELFSRRGFVKFAPSEVLREMESLLR